MTITRNFKLCLNAGTQNAPYINVNQYDEGEEWVFDLYTEGGQKFTPSTGAIIGIKADGNAILNSGTVDVIYHADTKLYIDKRIAELG